MQGQFNNPQGFAELQEWLNIQGVTNLHSCMEAASTYGNALEIALAAIAAFLGQMFKLGK